MEKTILFFSLVFFSASLLSQIEEPIFFKNEVDELPENYGGKNELLRFIYEQLVYPEEALTKKIEGKVVIAFICNEKSEITKYSINSSDNFLLNDEAIRLFKLLKWNSAIKNKKPITAAHFIEIPFNLKKYKKQFKKKQQYPLFDSPEDTSIIIYQKTDQLPEYIFGKDSLDKFIASELEYPHEALLQNLEGNVKLGFIIEKNGKLSNIHVLKQLGAGCQEEATRVLAETIWKPALKNGKRVRCQMEYTFYFKLNNQVRDHLMKSQNNSQY